MRANLSKYKDMYGNFSVNQYFLDVYGTGLHWVSFVDYKKEQVAFTKETVDRLCGHEKATVIRRNDTDGNYSILINGEIFVSTYQDTDGLYRPAVGIPFGHIMDLDFLREFLVEAKPKALGSISLVIKAPDGWTTCTKKEKDKEVDVALNYSDEVNAVYPKILASLTNEPTGLHIIHGPPGTGKSRFIRHLATVVPKNFIFIPNSLFFDIDDPSFIPLLKQNEGCILVVEDAENLIRDRKSNNSSSVSSLLNITDGIISDILNITVVLTYNCDDNLIDPALLRKGRVKSKTEFGCLSEEKAINLAINLGKDSSQIKGKMTLGDVYNIESESFAEKKNNKIGF